MQKEVFAFTNANNMVACYGCMYSSSHLSRSHQYTAPGMLQHPPHRPKLVVCLRPAGRGDQSVVQPTSQRRAGTQAEESPGARARDAAESYETG